MALCARRSAVFLLTFCWRRPAGDAAAGAELVAALVAATPDARADFVRDVARCLAGLAPLSPSLDATVVALSARLADAANPEHDAVRADALQLLTRCVGADALPALRLLRVAVVDWTLPYQVCPPYVCVVCADGSRSRRPMRPVTAVRRSTGRRGSAAATRRR